MLISPSRYRLSITEWKPVTGALPPMNQADWEECFTKYKDSPEYRILNPNMNLEEFKFIYYMEWGHRLWGRFIGISFVLPAAYFIARGRVTKRMACSLVGIAGMIGFQGFIGWWMVKSGLHDDLFVTPGNAVPRVSQYRLTTHLAAAFTVYLAMLYSGLSVLKENKLLRKNAATISVSEISLLKDPRLIPIRRTVIGILVLTFITAMTGGLVAGLDAGLIYNEFPYMGTGLKPPNAELMDGFYARDKENFTDLWWRNLLENPSMVQFQHRCLAVTTFTAILAFWAFARYGRGGKIWKTVLTKKMRAGIDGSMHLVSAQAALGISTLIYMVPISLAAAHQAGSLALLTGLMVLSSRLSIPPYLAEAVSRRMQLEMSGITNGGKGGVEERTGTGSSPPARPNVSFRSIARGSGEALNPAVITRNMPPIPATSTASSESEKTTPVFKIRRFGLKPPPTFRASRLITSQPSDSSFTTTSSKPQPSDASSTSSLSKPEREDLVKYRPLIASEVPKVRLLLSKKAASARSAREKEEWAAKGKEPMEPGQWPKSVSVRSPETVKPFKRPPGPAREYF